MYRLTQNWRDSTRIGFFNFIFGSQENRKWTLSLYNAVNGSSHTDETKIEFNTLKDVLYIRMLNINYGHNEKLLSACQPLYEYAWLLQTIRDYIALDDIPDIEAATSLAIDNMPDDFTIKEFLEVHRAEVKGMLLTEYDEAEAMEIIKKEAHEEGREEGRQEIDDLYSWLKSQGRNDDIIRAIGDGAAQNELLEEFKNAVK